MKIINGFVIITMIFFFNSCKKEPSTDLPPGTVDTSKNNVDTLLYKFIEIDTTKLAGLDTMVQIEYSYDLKKRISQIKQYVFDIINQNGLPRLSSTKFIYAGNDGLPSIRVTEQSSTFPASLDTTFLFYNSGSSLSKDSTRLILDTSPGYSYVRKQEYLYNVNQTTVIRTDYYTTPISVTTTTITSKYTSGGNVALYHSVNNYQSNVDQNFTYDNHPNPFNIKGTIGYIVLTDLSGLTVFTNMGSINNFTSLDNLYVDYAAHIYNSYSFSYIYRSNGFPESVYFYESTPGSEKFLKKGLYFYSH